MGRHRPKESVISVRDVAKQSGFSATRVSIALNIAPLAPFNSNTPQPPLAVQALDQNYLNPQSYQYSSSLQYEVMADSSFEINYVGGHQIHLGRNRNINQISDAASETAKLEFRTDFFNAGNHVQFNSLNGRLDTNFQVPLDPVARLPIPGARTINPTFGQLSAARDPREIQFSSRLVF